MAIAIQAGCSGLSNQQASIPENPTQPVKAPNPYWEKQPRVDETAKALFASAVELLDQGEHEEAEKHFIGLTETHPKLSGPWVNLGIINYQRGELSEAEGLFIKALKANDLNTDAYAYLGLILREQGRFGDSELVYKKALSKWPDNPEIHLNLGILYDLYMGQPTLALQQYLIAEGLSEEPSRQLRGWIVDLERRTQAVVQN